MAKATTATNSAGWLQPLTADGSRRRPRRLRRVRGAAAGRCDPDQANHHLGHPDDGVGIDESLQRSVSAIATSLHAPSVPMRRTSSRWRRLEAACGPAVGPLRGHLPDVLYCERRTSVHVTAERATRGFAGSKRFGVLYQPTPMASFHFSYGTSFNTSGDTYQYDALGSNTPPGGQPQLRVGRTARHGRGNASVRLALFHATKYNERNRDEDSVNATTMCCPAAPRGGHRSRCVRTHHACMGIYMSYAWIPDAEVDRLRRCWARRYRRDRGPAPGLTPSYTGTLWRPTAVANLRLVPASMPAARIPPSRAPRGAGVHDRRPDGRVHCRTAAIQSSTSRT